MTTSVVILLPVYRNQGGLDRSLESLREADGSFDVIVVDDGSPQPIQAPLQLRALVRVSLLRLAKNQGIAGALNAGLGLALERGYEFIARLDAGDTVDPSRFERQIAFLQADPSCALVSSFVDFVAGDGVKLFRHRCPTDHAGIVRGLRVNNCLMHPASMLRAEAIRKVGLYREDVRGAEDYELFLRMADRFALAVLPEPLTRMAYDPAGLSIAGRRQQQRTRLRLQLQYFDPASIYSFVGVARTLLAMLTPHAAVHRFKRACMH